MITFLNRTLLVFKKTGQQMPRVISWGTTYISWNRRGALTPYLRMFLRSSRRTLRLRR